MQSRRTTTTTQKRKTRIRATGVKTKAEVQVDVLGIADAIVQHDDLSTVVTHTPPQLLQLNKNLLNTCRNSRVFYLKEVTEALSPKLLNLLY